MQIPGPFVVFHTTTDGLLFFGKICSSQCQREVSVTITESTDFQLAMASMSDETFPAQFRIRESKTFDQVYEQGQFAANATLVVTAVKNGLEHTRLGLSLSRRVGNAVVRNRWKRWIREAFRKQLSDLPPGLDLVIRPKLGAVPDFDLVSESILPLVRRVARKLFSPGTPS
jgi:ribonuclease P protein component